MSKKKYDTTTHKNAAENGCEVMNPAGDTTRKRRKSGTALKRKPVPTETVDVAGAQYEVPVTEWSGLDIETITLRTPDTPGYGIVDIYGCSVPPYVKFEPDSTIEVSITRVNGYGGEPMAKAGSIYISIFAYGETKPLLRCKSKCGYETKSKFARMKGCLAPGEYVLAISGARCTGDPKVVHEKNHLFIYFVVLNDEANGILEVDNISADATFLVMGDMREKPYCRVMLNCRLTKDYGAYEQTDGIVVDSQGRIMSDEKIALTPMKRGYEWTCDLQLTPYLHDDETYTLVLVGKEKMIGCIPFRLDGTEVRADELPHDKNRCEIMARACIAHRACMKWLSVYPGCSGLRERAYELYGRHRMYKRLSEEEIADYDTRPVNIVVTNDYYPTNNTPALALGKLLNMRGGRVETIDLNKDATIAQETTTSKIEKLLEDTNDDEMHVLYNPGAMAGSSGALLAKRMQEKLDAGEQMLLYGTTAEVEQVFKLYPQLKRYFDNDYRMAVEESTAEDLMHFLVSRLTGNYKVVPDDEAATTLRDYLTRCHERGLLSNFTPDEAKRYAEAAEKRLRDKVMQMDLETLRKNPDVARIITVDELDLEYCERWEREMEESLAAIRQMTGLHNMKERIEMITTEAIFEQRYCRGNRQVGGKSHHMIFTGNPGTGKTTVAKMMGRIFRALGILSKGEVIVTERSRLVGRYIGETENNMREILEEARGNVLFIDEAYSLCNGGDDDRKDFGYRVVESLLTTLAAGHSDIVVILAGYKEEMEQLLNANMGLRGRFPHHIHFDDYSAHELMTIGSEMLAGKGYAMTAEAHAALAQIVEREVKKRDRNFSNARWMQQVLEYLVIPATQRRLIAAEMVPAPGEPIVIEQVDVEAARATMEREATTRQRCTIGFCA